jgi:hypothetical protein
VTLDEFFAGHERSRALFDVVRARIESLGPVEMRVTRSQVAFRRAKAFAWAWMPDVYLGRGAPLVLSIALRRRDVSPRWKQVVEPAAGRFMHHLELHDASDVDVEVEAWVREAWEAAAR